MTTILQSVRVTRGMVYGAIALSMAACSSGGDGGADNDNGGQPAPPVPTVAEFTLAHGGFRFEVPDWSTVWAGVGIEGTYDKTTQSFVIFPSSVPRVGFEVENSSLSLLLTQGGVFVEEALKWRYGEPPTAGKFGVGPADFVTMTVIADAAGTGQPGVALDYFTLTAPVELTWAQLHALLSDDTAPAYQVTASFGYELLKRVLDLNQLFLTELQFITENDSDLAAAGSGVGVERACDTSPVDGTLGTSRLTWLDGPGSTAGDLGPGDNFEASFSSCFRQPGAGLGVVWRSGTARLSNYVEDAATLGFLDARVTALDSAPALSSTGATVYDSTALVDSFATDVQGGRIPGGGMQLFVNPVGDESINPANTVPVAEAVIAALATPTEIGAAAFDLLSQIQAADPASGSISCTGGGRYDYVTTGTVGATGWSVALTFAACVLDPNDPVSFVGTTTLTLQAISGLLGAASYDATVAVGPILLLRQDQIGSTQISGAIRTARSQISGRATDITSIDAAQPMQLTEQGRTVSVAAAAITRRETAVGVELSTSINHIAMNTGDLAGVLDVVITEAVAANAGMAPHSGRITAEASDNSALEIVIKTDSVGLELDRNGDGTVDYSVNTTWDDLF